MHMKRLKSKIRQHVTRLNFLNQAISAGRTIRIEKNFKEKLDFMDKLEFEFIQRDNVTGKRRTIITLKKTVQV